ncbi:hypothetical protein UFOVP388_25 [uncultured Caudovirales phage]|uniref:Uncharacterized protein n=1 Tax=uncultured Caudovirales phage TaxID=2100421 RepID=A0A6J7X079_9CAUD|nr:hypothetical protein UFOVP388_25 [uncultured Caudovirales phage]
MATINIKGVILKLDDSLQQTPQGRNIRNAGFETDGKNTIYFFRYVGTHDFVKFEFNYKNEFVKTII